MLIYLIGMGTMADGGVYNGGQQLQVMDTAHI